MNGDPHLTPNIQHTPLNPNTKRQSERMPAISFNATEHKIKAVTIYSSNRAEIVRTFTVNLEVGQNEVIIKSLPSCVDLDGTRVTGLGDAVLFDVSCSLDDEEDTEQVLNAEERELLLAKTALENEKRVYERKADILTTFGRSLTSEFATPATVGAYLEQFQSQSAEVTAAVAELDAKISKLNDEITKQRKQQAKKRNLPKTNGKVIAVIMAKRSGEVEISLTYIVNKGISWTPSYDLRAMTEGGRPPRSVSLHYRASIVQNTGEDWRDVALTLSTATPGTISHVPRLRSIRVAPQDLFAGGNNNNRNAGFGPFANANVPQALPAPSAPFPQTGSLFGSRTAVTAAAGSNLIGPIQQVQSLPQQQQLQQQLRQIYQQQQQQQLQRQQQPTGFGFGQGAYNTAIVPTNLAQANPTGEDSWTTVDANASVVEDVHQALVGESEDEPGAWSESGTTVTDSAVSSSFRIDGLCSIPSEKTPHKVTIAVLTFDALVQYVAVPPARASAFLQCEVTNSSEYRLLPGTVHVYLDNTHVSKTSILDVNPEEKFNCTLGPDPALRIKYVRKPRNITMTTVAFSAQTTCSTYHVTTSLQNTHSFAVKDVVLRDVIPLPPDVQGIPNTLLQSIRVILKEPKGLTDAKPGELVDAENKSLKGKSSSVKVRWIGANGDKSGKYEWVASVGAGDEVQVDAVIEVHSPSHYNWQLVQESTD